MARTRQVSMMAPAAVTVQRQATKPRAEARPRQTILEARGALKALGILKAQGILKALGILKTLGVVVLSGSCLLAGSACAPRFPDIYFAANSVTVENVMWVAPTRMALVYQPPQAHHSSCRGAEVVATDERIEVRFVQRYGKNRGVGPGRQQVVFDNPKRLPVVVTDDVEDILIWNP